MNTVIPSIYEYSIDCESLYYTHFSVDRNDRKEGEKSINQAYQPSRKTSVIPEKKMAKHAKKDHMFRKEKSEVQI
jgi:hypothetical protein